MINLSFLRENPVKVQAGNLSGRCSKLHLRFAEQLRVSLEAHGLRLIPRMLPCAWIACFF